MDQSGKFPRQRRGGLAVLAICGLIGAGLSTACARRAMPDHVGPSGSSSSASAGSRVLLWGGDPEGGAPFVEADPRDPSVMRGFDVEIAGAIAQGLGRRAEFVPVSWDAIDQSVRRGDFAIGMSGVEDTPARRARMLETVPYYEFAEVLTVRAADRDRFRTLADLRGRRIGTLGATMAYTLLLNHAATDQIVAVSYDDDVHPYQDLLSGRLDAVVLDNIIAARSMRQVPGLVTQPQPLEIGHYVGVLAPGAEELRDRINAVLLARMRDGTIRQILTRWGVWDARQARFEAALLDGAPGDAPPSGPIVAVDRGWAATLARYVPALVEAAAVTVLISCGSMALAVMLGALIAAGRI
jgi:polar amino acid transport system substrate-binding protein